MTKEKIEKKIMFWSWLMMVTMTLGMIIGGIYLLITTFKWNPIEWFKNFKAALNAAKVKVKTKKDNRKVTTKVSNKKIKEAFNQ